MAASAPFEKHQLIRFHHCDPSGIVFHPEYIAIVDELIEDWFNEGLNINFAQLHADQQIGIPVARIEVDFLSPSKIGESLCLRLVVKRIGNKSFTLMVEGSVGGQIRMRALLVRVVTALDGFRGVSIPTALRERLERFM